MKEKARDAASPQGDGRGNGGGESFALPTLDSFAGGDNAIVVIGLGYVGLPLAVEFARHFRTVGFDTNARRIAELRDHHDTTGEISPATLKECGLTLTDALAAVDNAKLFIVTVPTPIDHNKNPDLTLLRDAATSVGGRLTRGAVVVFESTIYPGVTEDVCIPLLEEASGLRCGDDFTVGYSPERIVPGDASRPLSSIKKVVGALDAATTAFLTELYGAIIEAGVHAVSNIKTAEAAKVIENIQRDLNIALMNELSLIFDRLGINTMEVIRAAATKWNFVPYEPGLVGGHCIGVDPYYLTFRAEAMGYHPTVILAGRRINDMMGIYVAQQTIKQLINAGKVVKNARVLILGFTFKENVRDVRNTKIIDIVRELQNFGLTPTVYDPHADTDAATKRYGIELAPRMDTAAPYDAVVVAVKHREFTDGGLDALKAVATADAPVLIDIKSLFTPAEARAKGFLHWSL